jgi:inosine-uridine nucleoside N-ribohydrolase
MFRMALVAIAESARFVVCAGGMRIAGVVLSVLSLFAVGSCSSLTGLTSQSSRLPVIFDTDICDDIDDTWALALLVQSPELDIKLITTEVGNTSAKARTVAKFLQVVGRANIPIGIGIQNHENAHRQDGWAKDYQLSSYPGKIYKDGVQALIDTIMKSPRRITIIAVGPLPNIAAALEREPRIALKADFVGMQGSIRRGYAGVFEPTAEYNVRAYVKASQRVFTAAWPMTITPLDTCGIVDLSGEKYRKMLQRNSPLTIALMENYRAWYRQGLLDEKRNIDQGELNRKLAEQVDNRSTTLFDTVAVYLAITTELVKMEQLPVKVTDDGRTRIDPSGKVINCATEWKDLSAFQDFLVGRLTK